MWNIQDIMMTYIFTTIITFSWSLLLSKNPPSTPARLIVTTEFWGWCRPLVTLWCQTYMTRNSTYFHYITIKYYKSALKSETSSNQREDFPAMFDCQTVYPIQIHLIPIKSSLSPIKLSFFLVKSGFKFHNFQLSDQERLKQHETVGSEPRWKGLLPCEDLDRRLVAYSKKVIHGLLGTYFPNSHNIWLVE